MANTLIFVVCGMLIGGWVYRAHRMGGPWTLQGSDYGFAVALWLLLLARPQPHSCKTSELQIPVLFLFVFFLDGLQFI